MKTTLLAITILLLPLSAHAFEHERLQRACMIEQGSLLKDRNGTPSCDQLKKLNKQSSAKRKGNAADSDKPKKAGKPKKVATAKAKATAGIQTKAVIASMMPKVFPASVIDIKHPSRMFHRLFFRQAYQRLG